MYYATVVCTEWFIYFGCTFLIACYVPTSPQDFFCVCNALVLNYIGYESDGNDLKATGGVTTFVYLCKM